MSSISVSIPNVMLVASVILPSGVQVASVTVQSDT